MRVTIITFGVFSGVRVFLTGGSGWIGSAALPELLKAGHSVVGLARSDESAAKLTAQGAEPIRGELTNDEVLHRAAQEADAVVHLAFEHVNDLAGSAEKDMRATTVLSEALAGTGKVFIAASGTPSVPGKVATERDNGNPQGPFARRLQVAQAVVELAKRNVRSSVIRFPRSVHGVGDKKGLITRIIQLSRQLGVAVYLDDGSSRWPAVHRFDAAKLVCLALERAPAGSVLHAVGDEGVPLAKVAEVIGRKLSVPTKSVSPEALGFLGLVMKADQPASSALTQELVGWKPTHPGLLADLEDGDYFA